MARRPNGAGAAHDALIEALYRDHIHRLRSYIARVLGSVADADEIANDAFVRLYRSDLTRYHDPCAVLFRTGWRLALNRIRSRSTNPLDRADVPLADGDRFACDAGTAEDYLLDREREDAYNEAIKALPPRCREVIELRAVEGLSYKEMARRLDLSVSTLEKHVVKGKKACIEALTAWHADVRPLAA
ncbi:RNA polymerase sigma factor [Hephaestia sp. GCM10023244]|uniref:RNA polymerase sigma factor n=1 Tax=unclassified Hephaestia TaxID=2631281 RepID=UPI0020771876|nr:RNA polymerase sigma factor [Hephaestia sp. MAHUQ-44]